MRGVAQVPGTSLMSRTACGEPPRCKATLYKPVQVSSDGNAAVEGEGFRHVRISARSEDDNSRVSGELQGMWHSAACNESKEQIDRCLARRVRTGCVRLLQLGCATPTDTHLPTPPCAGADSSGEHAGDIATCAAWAGAWLQDRGEAGLRLARQIGAIDVLSDFVERIQPAAGRAFEAVGSAPFASMSSRQFASTSVSEEGGGGGAWDVCFVVLAGSELRLAIYALPQGCGAKHQHGQRPQQRLRLLSGDAHNGQENHFVYTLSRPEGKAALSVSFATEFAQEELDDLHIALSTGDWGFVTLL